MRDIKKYLLAKQKLKELDLEDLEAVKIQTKVQHMKQKESSTRYFYSCEQSEGLITEEELLKAVRSMENNKSPGIDGLTTNFFKHFWPILCEKLRYF